MLTLYESCDKPVGKVLYDDDELRVMGVADHKGWVWYDGFNLMHEQECHYVEELLDKGKVRKLGPQLSNYKTTKYDSWEDFVIDQL